jgi:hypothetical protein
MLTRHKLPKCFLSWFDFSMSIDSISHCVEGYLQGTVRKKPRRSPAPLRGAPPCTFSVIYFTPETLAAAAHDQKRIRRPPAWPPRTRRRKHSVASIYNNVVRKFTQPGCQKRGPCLFLPSISFDNNHLFLSLSFHEIIACCF